jgi:hypothetical protein
MVDFVHMKLGIIPGIESQIAPTKQRAAAAVSSRLAADPAFVKHVAKIMDQGASTDFRSMVQSTVPWVLGSMTGYPHSGTVRDVVRALRDETPALSSMSDEEAVAHLYTKAMIDKWAADAGSSPQAVAYHLAASKVHGTNPSGMLKFVGKAFANDAKMMLANNEDVLTALVRAEYAATQDILKQAGVKELTLYRGMAYPTSVAVGDTVKNFMNPLSSWALERDVAESFAISPWSPVPEGGESFVVAMTVPVEQVQSFFATGRGCMEEWEFVLIGHPSDGTVVDVI